jgi:tetratricopeptide (TPR) repeat protein
MRLYFWVGTVALLIGSAGFAQSRLKPDINAETPEGKLLQDIGQTQEDATRLELIDKFLAAHGSHASAPWALGQGLISAQKLNQHDKVIAAATKLMAIDPTDVEIAYAGLQAAVSKADNGLIMQWAAATVEAAKKASALPEPADEEEIERWKYRIAFSKADQAPKRAEYEVFTMMARTQDPAARIKALDALTALNPKSEYLAQGPTYYFTSYRQLNQNDKALELAAKAAEANTADEDMLLLLTNTAFEKKDQAGTIKYADQLTELLKTKPVPAGADPAAWEKKKAITMGAGLWLKGMTLAVQSKWKETDAALREAAPLLQENPDLLSHALFNIGLANYRMGNLNEALKFNQECAALKGPKQAEAAKNAAVIRQQGGGAAPKKAGGKK